MSVLRATSARKDSVKKEIWKILREVNPIIITSFQSISKISSIVKISLKNVHGSFENPSKHHFEQIVYLFHENFLELSLFVVKLLR